MRSRSVTSAFTCVAVLACCARAVGAEQEVGPRASEILADTSAHAGGLTSERVASRAVVTSFEVSSRRADDAAARAHVEDATVGLLPRLTVVASYTRNSAITVPSFGNSVVAPTSYPIGPVAPGTPLYNVPFTSPVLLDQYFTQATLTVPISDYLLRLSRRYAAAQHSERAADLSRRAEELFVAANARVAFYEWARARLTRAVTGQGLVQARLHLHDAQALFANGLVPSADVLRVESQVAANELLLGRAADAERAAEDRLRTLMHSPAGEAFEIGEDLSTPLPNDEPTNLDPLVTRAARDRLELREFRETATSLSAQASATRAGALPRLEGGGAVVYADPNPRYIPNQARFDATWSLGLQLTWAPNDTFSSLAQAKETDARAASVREQEGAFIDGVRTEISQAIEAWTDARIALETSARRLVASEESYRVRRSLFLNQRATSVELSDAESDVLRARLDAVNARIEQRVAKIRLAHAVGRDAS